MKKIKLIVIFITILITNTVKSQDISKLFEELDKSVVIINVIENKITGAGENGEKMSFGALGTGVLINKTGQILTAAHVVNGADLIEVIFKDGQRLQAKTEGLSRMADVAIIKTQGVINNPFPAKIGNSDNTKIGNRVMVIGNPMGLNHSLSVGYISRKEERPNASENFSKMEFFQTDAAINTGNSGGPMFNMDGEVIGIVSSILSRSGGFEGIGFAATINIVKELLIDHSNTWLGIDVFLLEGSLAKAFNVYNDAGILVQNVTKDSPAYYMGMKGGNINIMIGSQQVTIGGDIILAIDNTKLNNPKNIGIGIDYLNALPKGAKYSITVLRAGEKIKLNWIVK